MSSTSSTTPAPPPAAGRAPIWTLRLWELRDPRLDLAVTLATVLLLAVTRFAFLPSGPWEWDETLFARGILHFDIRAHFPHPPGFPLWLALGWLVHPLVSEPLVGLQLLSSTFSVLTLWPLAALCRRAAPAVVANLTALVFLMLPGVWLYAPRGFSATPAAFFALWAIALLVDGLEGRRATAFSALVIASFLIRPILMPAQGLVWIAGALTVRPRRRLLPGIAIGGGATVIATVAMVAIQGSWESFAAAFVDHATRHARGLAENVAGFSGLGIVTGSGGVWVSVTLLVLGALGLVVWARLRGRRFAAAWAVVWAVGVAQLVWLQDRTYPRYAVPFQLAAAPLVAAAAAAAAPVPAAVSGLVLLGAYLSLRTYPAVVEQHVTEMPAWTALRFASSVAERDGYDLVVEPGLAPFTSYLLEVDRSHGRPWQTTTHLAPSPLAVKTLPERRYLVLTDKPQRYLPALDGRSWLFSGESEELDELGQRRFDRAMVLENPPLPVLGWQNVANDEKDIPFAWGSNLARVLLPPLPAHTSVSMEVEPTRGPASVELQVNGVSAAVLSGTVGRKTVWLEPGLLVPDRTNELVFSRVESYSTGPRGRPQALRLSGLRAIGGLHPWGGPVATSGDRARLGIDVESTRGVPNPAISITGVLPAETLADGLGTWTQPTARITAPASPGDLRLLVWAPRPTPPQLEVWVGGRPFAGPLTIPARPSPIDFYIAGEATGATLDVELRSTPYTPAKPTPAERGPLGVVVGDADFSTLPGWPGQPWNGEIDRASRIWQFSTDAAGMYSDERFGEVRGAWTRPTVTVRLPAGPGRLTLTALAPRPVAPRLEVYASGRLLAGPLDVPSSPTRIDVDLPASTPIDRLAEIELRSVPYTPGGRDMRQLGIVLTAIEYQPAAALH